MPAEALQQMREALDLLLGQVPAGRRREDIAGRLQLMQAELQAGKLPGAVQVSLRQLALAAAAGDLGEANRVCSALVAQSWDEHREWLVGLKRLLAPR